MPAPVIQPQVAQRGPPYPPHYHYPSPYPCYACPPPGVQVPQFPFPQPNLYSPPAHYQFGAPQHGLLLQQPPPTDQGELEEPQVDEEEDYEFIKEYFRWKLRITASEARKERLKKAWQVVRAEMWTVEHLKGMSKVGSDLYDAGKRLGLPDGLMRNFADDLELFNKRVSGM